MKYIIYILYIVFTASLGQGCVPVIDELTVYPAKGEYYNWEMNQLFYGQGLKYSFETASEFFKKEDPIFEAINPTAHSEAGTDMISLVAWRQPENGAWLNHFAFLEEDTVAKEIDLHYAEGPAVENWKPPSFNKRINIIKDEPKMHCFDLEYITSGLWIVDCSEFEDQPAPPEDPIPMKNYFYLIDYNSDPDSAKANRQETSNYRGYTKIGGRKIQYHTYFTNNFGNSQDELQVETPEKILLRGQTAYNSETGTPQNLDSNCIIEVFKVGDNNEIVDTNHHLDKGIIAKDIGLSPDDQLTFEFQLIDFKIQPNGDVYILDAKNGLFIYTITDTSNWKFKKLIQTYAETAYALDVALRFFADGRIETHVAVLYQYDIIVYTDGVQSNGYHLTDPVSFPSAVFISQNFVVSEYNKKLSLYSSQSQYFITSIGLLAGTYAINPYEPDLLSVSNTQAHRYVLSHGFLSVSNPSTATLETVSFNLIATDPNNDSCKLKVTYKILSDSDVNIYDMNSDPFPNIITFPADPFDLKQIASGPNLQYAQIDTLMANSHVDVNVYSRWQLEFKGVTWPAPTDIVYADIINDPYEKNANKFYFLFQQKNLQVTIWDCMHEVETDAHATCDKQDSFPVPIQLNRDRTQFDWHVTYAEQLTMLILEDDYNIGMYISHEGSTEKLYTITYPSTDPKNKITSFVVLSDVVYVVLSGQKVVDCYYSFFPTVGKFQINQEFVTAQGYTEDWSPTKVFGNQLIKAQLIFIQCKDNILMGDYKYTFTLLRKIPILSGSSVQIAMGVNTFFIVQKTATQDLIQEYNYQTLTYVYLAKNLPLFNKYTIQTPLTADFSSSTGYLLIRALDITAQKTVLLVYEPNVLSHNSLHQVLNTNELIKDGDPLYMAITGGQQMFIYLNDQKKQTILSLYQNAIMTLTPNALSQQYVTKLDAAVKISNYDGVQPINLQYPVKFLNTQSIPKIDQNVINSQNANYVYSDKPDSQYIPLGNTWYSGSILKFDIECKDCQSHLIELLNPIYHLTDGSEFDQIVLRDGAPFNNNMIIYQSDTSLIAQKPDDTRAYVYKMELPNYTYCDVLTVADDQQHVLSGCLEKDQATIFVAKCDSTQCHAVEPKTRIIQDASNVGKLMLKDGVLIVLNAMPSYPTSMDGNIHMFSFAINAGTQQWEITNKQIIDKDYLNSQFRVQMADFDLIKFTISNVNYYKLFISDADSGLFFVDYVIEGGKAKYNRHEQLGLYNLLNEKQAIFKDTKFYQVRVTEQAVSGTELIVTAIVSTNNMAHYAIKMKFDVSNPQTGYPYKTNSATIPYLLNQYGTWSALNKLSFYNGVVAIPYTNRLDLMVAVYELPKTTKEGETQMVAFLGAEREYYQYPHVDFVMLLTKDNTGVQTNPVLYTNVVYSRNADNHMLIKYGLSNQPQLHVQNGHQVESQKIQITASNTFNEASGTLSISKSNPVDPGDDSKGSSNWWWITLIVVFGVALLAGGAFFGYKKYQQRNHVDPLLG